MISSDRCSSTLSLALATLLVFLPDTTKADGTGLIGYGKTLYNPTCTFACRNVIRRQTLACTPTSSTANHGTAHNPVSTPPKCFVQDPTFLKTMALCIDIYCNLSDKPSQSLVEDYWASHLGTGTLGNYQFVPVLSYKDALAAARKDEEIATATGNNTASKAASVPKGLKPFEVSSPLPITTGGSSALNRTSLVAPVQWQLQYNYLSDFEINEKGHSTMTIVIAVVAMGLPIILSLARFLPGLSNLKSIFIHPALLGKRHREPLAGGLNPSRGQAIYICLISILNLVLLVAPCTIKQPQASFTTKGKQLTSIIGNRAGTMAMGNVVALFLFSSRNSALLYLTDWSYSTYLLLHRWLGYWAVIHTIIHSAMLWKYYDDAGTYAAELLRLYWRWGIVGTVAICALIPFSILEIRQKFYEFFLVSHIVLSLIFLIGYYYHIWYVYTYNWGYEIWMFVAAGIWALERSARIVRIALHGTRTATVTVIPDTNEEYIRIEADGKVLNSGVAYLCFPTLSWRFWETHPFSVSGAVPTFQYDGTNQISRSDSDASPVQDLVIDDKEVHSVVKAKTNADEDHSGPVNTTTFIARTRDGVTKNLLNRALKSEKRQTRLRVLIEGPYNHSGQVDSQLAKCDSVICIAGGVGITACLPFIEAAKAKDVKLFWSSRKSGLVANLKSTLDTLPSSVQIETLIGQRFNLDSILQREFAQESFDKGWLGIVVSGPPSLADDVRDKVVRAARKSGGGRSYVLVDEAFSW